jgi:hypothetical protein
LGRHALSLTTCCDLHALNVLEALVRKLPLTLQHHLVESLEVIRRHNLTIATHMSLVGHVQKKTSIAHVRAH